MISRVRDAVLPSVEVAVTVIAQRPGRQVERRARTSRPSTATVDGRAVGAGRRRRARRRAPGGAPRRRPSSVAGRPTIDDGLRVRRRALDRDRAVAVGRALGRLGRRSSVGAWKTRKGTVMHDLRGVSDCLAGLRVDGADVEPVLAAPEVDLEDQSPLGSGRDADRLLWPAALIVTVAPGVEVPASRNEVASSSTSNTAVAGLVTASVGGLE